MVFFCMINYSFIHSYLLIFVKSMTLVEVWSLFVIRFLITIWITFESDWFPFYTVHSYSILFRLRMVRHGGVGSRQRLVQRSIERGGYDGGRIKVGFGLFVIKRTKLYKNYVKRNHNVIHIIFDIKFYNVLFVQFCYVNSAKSLISSIFSFFSTFVRYVPSERSSRLHGFINSIYDSFNFFSHLYFCVHLFSDYYISTYDLFEVINFDNEFLSLCVFFNRFILHLFKVSSIFYFSHTFILSLTYPPRFIYNIDNLFGSSNSIIFLVPLHFSCTITLITFYKNDCFSIDIYFDRMISLTFSPAVLSTLRSIQSRLHLVRSLHLSSFVCPFFCVICSVLITYNFCLILFNSYTNFNPNLHDPFTVASTWSSITDSSINPQPLNSKSYACKHSTEILNIIKTNSHYLYNLYQKSNNK
jgi:hypothetical protein